MGKPKEMIIVLKITDKEWAKAALKVGAKYLAEDYFTENLGVDVKSLRLTYGKHKAKYKRNKKRKKVK